MLYTLQWTFYKVCVALCSEAKIPLGAFMSDDKRCNLYSAVWMENWCSYWVHLYLKRCLKVQRGRILKEVTLKYFVHIGWADDTHWQRATKLAPKPETKPCSFKLLSKCLTTWKNTNAVNFKVIIEYASVPVWLLDRVILSNCST